MHYKNGREAKVGDRVVRIGDAHNPPLIGILHSPVVGSDTCNARLAVITPNDAYITVKECLHLDDVAAAVIPDSGPTSKSQP